MAHWYYYPPSLTAGLHAAAVTCPNLLEGVLWLEVRLADRL